MVVEVIPEGLDVGDHVGHSLWGEVPREQNCGLFFCFLRSQSFGVRCRSCLSGVSFSLRIALFWTSIGGVASLTTEEA